jgi:hypothetical protein
VRTSLLLANPPSPLPPPLRPAADHFLRERGLQTACYHGDVPVEERREAIKGFAAEEVDGGSRPPLLVCTDLAARWDTQACCLLCPPFFTIHLPCILACLAQPCSACLLRPALYLYSACASLPLAGAWTYLGVWTTLSTSISPSTQLTTSTVPGALHVREPQVRASPLHITHI